MENIKALASIFDGVGFSVQKIGGVNIVDLHSDSWGIRLLSDIILDNNIEDVLIMEYSSPGRDYGGHLAYFNGQEVETAESYANYIKRTDKEHYNRELELLKSQGGTISALPNILMDSVSYKDDLTGFLISELNCRTVNRIPNLYSG